MTGECIALNFCLQLKREQCPALNFCLQLKREQCLALNFCHFLGNAQHSFFWGMFHPGIQISITGNALHSEILSGGLRALRGFNICVEAGRDRAPPQRPEASIFALKLGASSCRRP